MGAPKPEVWACVCVWGWWLTGNISYTGLVSLGHSRVLIRWVSSTMYTVEGACVKVLLKQDWWYWWHLISSTKQSARQTTQPIMKGKQSLLILVFKTLSELPLLLLPSLDMFWSSSLTLWFPSWGSWLLNGMLQNTAVPTGGIWPEHIINPLLFSLKGNFSLNSY